MKVGLTIDQCTNYKAVLNEKDKEIQALNNYIESMNNYFKQSQKIGQQLHNIILPLLKPAKPMTLETYIELSSLKDHNKIYLKNLFKKYLDFCKKDLHYTDYKCIDGCPLDLNLDIYNPDNVIRFMKEKCNFKRTSIKKIRDIFLLAMRKCTKNPSLDYSVPLGQTENPKLKHYIKYDELVKFLKYLKENRDYQLFIIFEILYKFGVRVGAVSKLKVNDISDDKTMIFHEKNNKVLKRHLKDKLYEKIVKLIKVNSLNINDYIFYPHLNKNDESERAKSFSNKLSKALKDSNCFNKKENETISAHMFRATHAINIFKKYGLDMAAKELNHNNSSTTSKHYVKIEERDLLYNEEEELFDKNLDKIINEIDVNDKTDTKIPKIKKKSKNKKKEKYNEEIKQLNELDEDDPELDNADESLLDSIFDLNIEKDNQENIINIEKINIGKKRKRDLIIKNEKPISPNEEYMIYEDFLKENNIDLKEIFVLEVNNVDKKNVKRNKEIFEKFLKNKNLCFSNQSLKINDKINSIRRAYSYEDIYFFPRNTLKNI